MSAQYNAVLTKIGTVTGSSREQPHHDKKDGIKNAAASIKCDRTPLSNVKLDPF